MRKLLAILILSCCIQLGFGQVRTVHFKINHLAKGSPLSYSLVYQNDLEQDYRFTRIEYFITGFEVSTDTGKLALIDSVCLVNAAKPAQYDLGSIDLERVDSLHFHFGVDKERNHGDPSVYPLISTHKFDGLHFVGWLLRLILHGPSIAASRGKTGEKKTLRKLKRSLSSATYRQFHDLIIPSSNGTTQIDHLVISPYGIFIIESKYRTGWIYGSADQRQWTQTVYRNKYSFQNPLRQTYRQKKVLAEFLGVSESKIYTVIHFTGNCRFKTTMPRNVLNSDPANYIQRFNSVVLSQKSILDVEASISNHVATSQLKNRHHIKSLKDRHSSDTICPRCGSTLVVRTTKTGRNAGSNFLGCRAYPKCRFTKPIN